MNLKDHSVYTDYLKMREQQMKFDENSLPLCASENIISPFCLLPLNDISHERYLLGGTISYNLNGFKIEFLQSVWGDVFGFHHM